MAKIKLMKIIYHIIHYFAKCLFLTFSTDFCLALQLGFMNNCEAEGLQNARFIPSSNTVFC